MKVLAIVAVLLVSSCAVSPIGAGNAQYTYSKGTDGTCDVTVNSVRALEGLDLQINEDCSMSVRATKANIDATYLNVIDKLSNLVPVGVK